MKTLAAFAALAAMALATPVTAAPLETYAQLPTIENMSLSDDGSMIAIAMNDGQTRKILVRPVASMEGAKFIDIRENILTGLSWRRDSNTELYYGTLLTTYAPTGGVYFTSQRFHTYDVKTGSVDAKTPGKADRPKPPWPLDEDLKPAVEISYDELSGRSNFRVNNKQIATGIFPYSRPRLLAKGKTPDTVLVAMDPGSGPVARELNITTGEWSAEATFSEDTGVFIDREGELFGTVRRNGEEEIFEFFSPEDKAMWATLKKSFPKDHVDIVTSSRDHKVVVVELNNGSMPPALVFVDLNTNKASFIANRWGAISNADIAPVKPLTYKAADGLDIPGYLTTPNGREAKGLPLVVLVHGGPAARDNGYYDWWAQALASRGYAVLQSNFRGSTGYDPSFQRAGFGEYGRKMQTDLSDGVRYLVGQGIVDPKRVCIMGASYGGYAALAGAAFDKGVYRCAASFAGVSDLEVQVAPNGSKGHTSMGRYFARYIGATDARDKVMDQWSPAKHAEDIDIPVLLIHGKDDLRVYYEQSVTMATAMKKAGKPVEFITLKGEDHFLSRGDTRLQMLTAMVTFLEKNNPAN